MAQLTPAQQSQLASIKKQAEALKVQVDAKVAAEKAKAPTQVGGGPSDKLRELSIALARGTAVPKGTKKDVVDASGQRTGATIDVGGTVQSTRSASLDPTVKAMLDAQDAYNAQRAALTGEAGSPIAPTQTGGAAAPAGSNAVGALMAGGITTPTGEDAGASLYQKTKDFFNKFLNPNATFGDFNIGQTAHTTPSGTEGFAGFAGGGAGGGGGGSWGGGAATPTTQGPVQGPVQPPTNKEQANRAGVPDTAGNSASQNMSGLNAALESLKNTLLNFDVNSITGTSDPVNNSLKNMDNALTTAYEKALADLPDYEKMQKNAEKLYKLKLKTIGDREDMLAERYAEDKAAIEADYATQKEEKILSQKGQTGRLAGGLAAAGAYLGFDNVNHSALLSLEVAHDRELTVLGQAKIAALSEARRAFEDADFALLGERINAIEGYDQKITELNKMQFDQTLALTQETRSNLKFMQDTETFERNKGFTNLDTIIEAGTMPTDADIKKYAQTFGLAENDVRQYITAKQNTKANEENRQKTSDDIALNNLLRGIDKGTFVTINGKRYEGLNTPSAGSGGADSSTRAMTYKDVFEKFGNSPIAREMVGMPIDSVYEFFGQQNYPTDIRDFIADGIPDLSSDPTTAEQQIQAAWRNMSNSTLGFAKNAAFGQMKTDDQRAALNELNQRLIDELGADQARAQLLTIDDLDNPNLYPVSYLELMAEAWKTRQLKTKTSITGKATSAISELLNSIGGQGTVTTLNQ